MFGSLPIYKVEFDRRFSLGSPCQAPLSIEVSEPQLVKLKSKVQKCSGNYSKMFRKQCENVKEIIQKCSGNNPKIFRKQSKNVQETIKKCSGNNQKQIQETIQKFSGNNPKQSEIRNPWTQPARLSI